SRGIVTTHRVDDELLFEIPDSTLGRELLLVVRSVATSSQSGFAGSRANVVVEWTRDGERVVLRERSYDATADTTEAIWRQVSHMRNGAVIGAMDVEAFGPDSAAVVEATDLFLSANPIMGSLEQVEPNRSWIESARAFPRNVEIEATQTGRERGANGGGNRPRPTTMRIHWSFLALPENPTQPRLWDRRVGFNSTRLTDYGRPEHRAEERRFIHRYRLEPSDTAAFREGEPVEPVEPIVFWADPATPDWLKPYVISGIEAWNRAFEDAGFTNAIEGRILPTDDPEYDLHDARYSVVYWRPSRVQNATGGQVVDPRTGEILKGEVNMYHNVQNLVRNWYFTQVGPLDSRARSFPLPDSLMGRLVEYVVAHEVGHAIGLPHNMKASAMYPPDSLRSESFLRRMNGHVSTLMDYSRFNYVAQPEDSIPPELLVPGIGPYDEFAVRWGYRPILDAESPDEERETLDEWARAQDTVPWLRFTTTDAPNDPRALTEAVGDADAVQSNTLGLRNLDRVMEMLIPVTERPGESYELLEELYGEAANQWSRYMGHVAAVVGGADTRELYGRGERFFPLDREPQVEAVDFLRERAFQTPQILVRPDILRRIEAEGVVNRVRDAQRSVLQALLSASRLTRLIEYEALAGDEYEPYPLSALMEDVRAGVWTELDDEQVRVDVYRRNLQRSYLRVVDQRLNPDEDQPSPSGESRMDPLESDIRPVLRGELRVVRDRARAAGERAADSMTRLHLEDVVVEVDRILDATE
ncbi:MAG: zinc-dependent metalloprotease, partial [Gemmatimonadota bacterium]